MDLNLQAKLYTAAATYKIPLLWWKKTDRYLFSFLRDLLVSHNLGGEETVMDLSATDYIC